MKRFVTMAMIVVTCWSSAFAADPKAPPGCTVVPNAKATTDGWADRILHMKTGIELVFVPAGTFTMGAKGVRSNSLPPHKVTITNGFYIGKTEVTNGQYRKFVKASGYDGKADTDPAYDLYLRHFRGKGIMSSEDDYPVVWVSWTNAKAFCKWAALALPSEAQWEYACRAGSTTLYYFGNEQEDFDDYGWGHTNSNALTHPVGQKKPNAWGLYDMLGSVWEWAEDDYVYRYEGAPVDGSARVEGKWTKVLRGGSWSNSTEATRCSSVSRFNSAPGNASSEVGFRVMLSLQ